MSITPAQPPPRSSTPTTTHDVEPSSLESPSAQPAHHPSSPPPISIRLPDAMDISTPPNLRTPDSTSAPTSASAVSPIERPSPTHSALSPGETQPVSLLDDLRTPPALPALSLETLPDQTLYATISNTLNLILSRLAASSPDTSTLRLSVGSGRTEEEAGIDREIYLRFMANSRGQIVHRLNTVRRIIAALLSWNEIDWSVPASNRSSSRAGVGRLPDGLGVIPGDDGRGERTTEMRGWLDRIDQALEEVRTLGEEQERYGAIAFGPDRPASAATNQQGRQAEGENNEREDGHDDTNDDGGDNNDNDNGNNNGNDNDNEEDEDEPTQMLSHSLLTGQVSLLRRRGAIHRSSVLNQSLPSISSSSTFSSVNRMSVPFPRHPPSFSALYRQGPRVSERTFPEEEEDGETDEQITDRDPTWSFSIDSQAAINRSKESVHLDPNHYILYCHPSSASSRGDPSRQAPPSSTPQSSPGRKSRNIKLEHHRRLLSPPSFLPPSGSTTSTPMDRATHHPSTETCDGVLSYRAFRPSANPKAFMGKEVNPVWEAREASGVGLLQDTVWGNMKR
ncbi:hypothetical protein [Phaffia rhodozyma]|uniref:Uncharacterized protein n=1 Tax=Phaffia rhodozyma TaxID=264483 RepID=A0A0F7SF11_PHARH|nr:hypothetical protein [Phaffia rhodozyma]